MSLIPIATKVKSVDESLEAIVLTDNKVIVTKGFATGQVLAMADWQILSGGRLPLTRASTAAVPFVGRADADASSGGFGGPEVEEQAAERSTTASPADTLLDEPESDAEEEWPAAWPAAWKQPAADDWVAFEARREEAERRARAAEMELEAEAAEAAEEAAEGWGVETACSGSCVAPAAADERRKAEAWDSWLEEARAAEMEEVGCRTCEFLICRCAEDVAAGDEEDTDAKQSRVMDELALIDVAAQELEKETRASWEHVMGQLALIADAARRGDKVVRLVL